MAPKNYRLFWAREILTEIVQFVAVVSAPQHAFFSLWRIHPATRWVHVEIKHGESVSSAKTFWNRVTAQGCRQRSEDHFFDQLCCHAWH